jgi:hypothetical protein
VTDPLVVEFSVAAAPPHAFHTLDVPVQVTFNPACGGTLVRIEQRGFERLGEAGPPRRARTGQVWTTITAEFADALAHTG